jgi:anti-sigma factor RsiW
MQAHLAVHPEEQAEWEEDLALTRCLQELPDVPVSSNFTSLVLRAVDAQTATEGRPAPAQSRVKGWLRGLAPRVAFAALAVALAIVGLFEYENHTRKQFVDGMERFVQVANLPSPEVFQDFDAIQRLQPVAFSSDDELLAALR